MTPVLLLAAALLAAADPCAPVVARAEDPAAASEYRAVGEAERARGDLETAAAAFRTAAALDAQDGGSRQALRALCAAGPGAPEPFAEGLRLLEADDARGAAAAFRSARERAGADPSAALLEGICRYELGEDAEAASLLREAEQAPAHRAAARLYLGMLALRAGAGSQAAALFDSAGASPSLARMAADLARLARREGRLVLSVLAESGWDSNVPLVASDLPGDREDGAWALTAGALWRPRGSFGPYLRANGSLHQQFTLDAYDFGAVDGAAGWQVRAGRLGLLAEYDYGYRMLGGDPFLSSHRLLASASLPIGRAVASLLWFTRFDGYSGAYQPFSGVVHRTEAKVSFPLGERALLALAYGGGRDLADAGYLSFLEHGPRAELRLALAPRVRLGVELAATFRAYDAADPAFGTARHETYLDGAALAEVDLTERLSLRAALQARRASSSVSALEYDKVVPTLGMSWTAGY
jgi:tetratricopeptide (TPR) repeat protein